MTDGEILAGTGRVIGRLGPGRLTLGEVAAEVGLAPATLLQRFGSKRGLLLAFVREASASAGAPFRAARAAEASPCAALLSALSAMTREVSSTEEMGNHLGLLQMDVSDPEFREHAAAHARRVREEIAALLAEAVAAGELGPRDPAAAARLVQTTYNGSLIGWAVDGEGPADAWVRRDVAALLDALAAAPTEGGAG